ncbi:hypothetical protein EMN47_09910 [Prolixibacteraceae bacterium JC049]|nr:hypothetical protein [Prolixibacteraceae bacterium JC049]
MISHFPPLFLLYVFINVILLQTAGFAQELNVDKTDKDPVIPSKLFIHTDRSEYFKGDTVWFKAYGWCGAMEIPDTLNRIVYVNIIDSKGDCIEEKSCYMIDGTAVGDWHINDNLPAGNYLLQAHTLNTLKEKRLPFSRTLKVSDPKESFSFFCYPQIANSAKKDSMKLSIGFREIEQNGAVNIFKDNEVNYLLSIGKKLLGKGTVHLRNFSEFSLKSRLPKGNEWREEDTVAVLTLSIPEREIEKQFIVPVKYDVDVQWLPESGTMLAGIENKVAFRSENNRGEGESIQGVIVSLKGDTLTGFKSNEQGIGCVKFMPKEGEKYSALITNKTLVWKKKLPEAVSDGVLLKMVDQSSDSIRFSVETNKNHVGETFRLIGHRHKELFSNYSFQLKGASTSVTVAKKELPAGVVVFSLMDNGYNNRAERLVFVDAKEHMHVECVADSVQYGKRDRVKLKIRTTDDRGRGIKTNLSLAVVDENQTNVKEDSRNISAYKLLSSELHGKVENAAGYFKNGATDLKGIDLVMLTHGYRKVQTEFVPDNRDSIITILDDKFYAFKGQIHAENKKRYDRIGYNHIKLSVMSKVDGGMRFIESQVDSTGHFSFTHPLHYDFARMVIQAQRPNRKKTGRCFYGTVNLESIPESWNFHLRPAVPSFYTKAERAEINRIRSFKKNQVSKTGAGVTWMLDLEEVTVTAKNKKWYEDFEGQAINIADMDTLDPTGKRYENLFDLLVRDFGAKLRYERSQPGVLLPCISMEATECVPIFLVNGGVFMNCGEMPDHMMHLMQALSLMQVRELKKVMVVPPTSELIPFYGDFEILGGGCRQSMVVIETYGKGYRGDPDGILTQIHKGLSKPRTFYSPKYNKNNSPEFDNRTTLYWNPTVITNEYGIAEVDFWTSDSNTQLDVMVNGVQVGTGITGSCNQKIVVRSKK